MPLTFEKTFDITIRKEGIKNSQTHQVIKCLGNEKKLKNKIVNNKRLENYDYKFIPLLVFKKTVAKYFIQFCLSNFEKDSYQIVPLNSELNYFMHKLKDVYIFSTQMEFLQFIKKFENRIPQKYIAKNDDDDDDDKKYQYNFIFNIVSDRTFKLTNACKNDCDINEKIVNNIFKVIQKLLKYKNPQKINKIINKHFNEIKKKYNNINNDNDIVDSDDSNDRSDGGVDDSDDNNDDDDCDDNNNDDDKSSNDNDNEMDIIDFKNDESDLFNINNIEKNKMNDNSLISLAESDFKKEFINPNSAVGKKIQVLNKEVLSKALKLTINDIQQDQKKESKNKLSNNKDLSIVKEKNNTSKKKSDNDNNNDNYNDNDNDNGNNNDNNNNDNDNDNNILSKRKIEQTNKNEESQSKKRKLIVNNNNINNNNNNENTKNTQNNLIYKFYNDSLKKVFVRSHTGFYMANEKVNQIIDDELKIELSFNDFLNIEYWKNNSNFSNLFVPIYYSLIVGNFSDHYNFKTKDQFIKSNPEIVKLNIVSNHIGLFDNTGLREIKHTIYNEEENYINLIKSELKYFNLKNIVNRKNLSQFHDQKMNITKFFLIWLNIIDKRISKNYIKMTLLNEDFNTIGLFDFKNSRLSKKYQGKKDFLSAITQIRYNLNNNEYYGYHIILAINKLIIREFKTLKLIDNDDELMDEKHDKLGTLF